MGVVVKDVAVVTGARLDRLVRKRELTNVVLGALDKFATDEPGSKSTVPEKIPDAITDPVGLIEIDWIQSVFRLP